MIYYTIYTSIPEGEVTEQVVNEITEESISWNNSHGITGMLLCLENRYFQFLEGDENDVTEVFDMIKSDPRHHDVTIRIKGFSNDRVFSDWSMGSWMLSNEELHTLPVFNDLRNYLEDPVNNVLPSKRFVSMMDNILQTWIAHEPERAKRLRGD